jgi:hypothetical protein
MKHRFAGISTEVVDLELMDALYHLSPLVMDSSDRVDQVKTAPTAPSVSPVPHKPAGLFRRLCWKLDRVFCGLEDHLFMASATELVEDAVPESEELPPKLRETEEIQKVADEVDRVHRLVADRAVEWFWPMYFMFFAVPRAVTVLSIVEISQLIVFWDPSNPDLPYAALFFGSIGLVIIGLYLAKIQLDDMNRGWRAKVVSRWNQLITPLEVLAISFLTWQDVNPLMVTRGTLVAEASYLLLFVAFVKYDPPADEMNYWKSD